MYKQTRVPCSAILLKQGLIGFIAVVVMLGASKARSGSAIGDLATSMQPGTFAELTSMNGWDSGSILVPTEFGCSSADYITQFADSAGWDRVNKRVLLVGQSHGSCYAGNLVIYSDATNTWSKGPYPDGICQSGSPTNPCFAHAYDHNAVDPATGDLYYRHYNGSKVWRFRNGTWTSIAPIPMPSAQCCGAMQFFPEMNRLIFIDGDCGVWSYNPASNVWTQLANTNTPDVPELPKLPMRSYQNFAAYNAVEKTLLFGGGSALYAMSADGTFTTLKSPPVFLGITNSVVSYDPVTGLFLVLAGSFFYQYDLSTDTWAALPTSVPPSLRALGGVGDGLVEATLNEYGVVMFIKYNVENSKVYLYKHSPYTPIIPKAPTALLLQ